ncbi:MAG: hypothetical protein LBV70_04595 [Candidatus Adiutrix sp.]|nr:hypothetical protein [Candidatus Adiutrix sp.]
MLSVGLSLAGLAGLLITRLRHPLVLELLRPWRIPAPPIPPGLEDQPLVVWPLMEKQFEIDLVAATMAGLGLFLIFYYLRRLSPLIAKIEEMRLDRW